MKHWPVQDAKARFSELLRAADKEPQIVTYRGKPKYEVRLRSTEDTGKPMTLAEAILSAPRTPGFRLPVRRREKPRKVF
jgi:prevent-host-death family protein